MKKLGIVVLTIAALTVGYLYFCGCCPESCCKAPTTSTEMKDNKTAPTYKLTTKEVK